nr:hypothetical protein BaRGS_013682 [Batillaria attramentaria]
MEGRNLQTAPPGRLRALSNKQAIIQLRLDLTIHKKDQTPDSIYLHGLQQILTDFPGFRPIFTDGSKSEDGRVGAAAVMDGRVFTRRLANENFNVVIFSESTNSRGTKLGMLID